MKKLSKEQARGRLELVNKVVNVLYMLNMDDEITNEVYDRIMKSDFTTAYLNHLLRIVRGK
jgi:hypothetical protein